MMNRHEDVNTTMGEKFKQPLPTEKGLQGKEMMKIPKLNSFISLKLLKKGFLESGKTQQSFMI